MNEELQWIAIVGIILVMLGKGYLTAVNLGAGIDAVISLFSTLLKYLKLKK